MHHSDIVGSFLGYLTDRELTRVSIVCKKWHAIVRTIIEQRHDTETRITATLHHKRWRTLPLKIEVRPRAIIAKRDSHLYVAYHNDRVYRWNLVTEVIDHTYLLPLGWTNICLRGNFLISQTAPTQHHFTHIEAEATFHQVGRRFSAWNDWIIFMTNEIGLYHYREGRPLILHHHVRQKNRFLKIIDDRLYTHWRKKVWVWDLKTQNLLFTRRIKGTLMIAKWNRKPSLRLILRNLNNERAVVYQSLVDNTRTEIKLLNAYRLLSSWQPISFLLDLYRGLFVGDRYIAKPPELPHDQKITRFGSYIILSGGAFFKIDGNQLHPLMQHKGRFFPDGTFVKLEKKGIEVLNLAGPVFCHYKEISPV